MERPSLQYPLPEEIQKMARDETVCKFCGVSYLIHNEIKALEDKLRAAEEELNFYRGIEEREEKLKLQIGELEKKNNQLQEEYVAKDAVLGTLKNDLMTKDNEIERIEKLKLDVEKQLMEVTNKCEQFRLQNILYTNKLPSIIKQIQQHKADSLSIGNLVTAQNTVLREECRLLQDNIIGILKERSAEVAHLQDHLSELERSTQMFKEKNDVLEQKLQEALQQVNELSPTAAHGEKLQVQVEQLNNDIQDMKKLMEEVTEKNRKLSMENDTKSEQIKKYVQDVQILEDRRKKHSEELQDYIAKCSKLQRDVNERDSQLDIMRREQEKMKQVIEETQAKLQQTASMSTSETEDLKEAVAKLSGDLEALKKEREMMITAHQNQIQQLRESFSLRIAEADKWPQKMERAIKQERDKHAAAMLELEMKLKENFVMELQIEKQKHQELLQKYQNDSRVDESQVKRQMDNIHNQYKAEISDLHKQIAENKARARMTENSIRDEVSGLKKIITDLEEKLACIDTDAESKIRQLKQQLHAAETELDEVRRDFNKQETEFATAKEEIVFLQETVRKECEERFELTEALSQAKEELLTLKKPPGGYGLQQAWTGSSRGSSASNNQRPELSRLIPANSTASLNSSRSEEITIYKKLAMNRPQPPSLPRDSLSDKEPINMNAMGLEGQKSNRSVSKGLKGASLNESRRRLSQALGRR